MLLAGLAACREPAGPLPGAALVSVTPHGGAAAVDPAGTIVLQWSGPMRAGMERFVALHRGSIQGPAVSLVYSWSQDHLRLTCAPEMALDSGTVYTLHVGGGMRDAAGGAIDMRSGMGMGGTWATTGMMGAGMMGDPMMGAGWSHGDGTYGMAFVFTTAGSAP